MKSGLTPKKLRGKWYPICNHSAVSMVFGVNPLILGGLQLTTCFFKFMKYFVYFIL